MMAKMRKKSPTTMDTLAMDARESVTERKTSIIPGLRVRVLKHTHTCCAMLPSQSNKDLCYAGYSELRNLSEACFMANRKHVAACSAMSSLADTMLFTQYVQGVHAHTKQQHRACRSSVVRAWTIHNTDIGAGLPEGLQGSQDSQALEPLHTRQQTVQSKHYNRNYHNGKVQLHKHQQPLSCTILLSKRVKRAMCS